MNQRYSFADVHCHLDDESFDKDRDNVIERARNVMILCAGQEPASNRKVLKLASTYPNVRACLGLHPEYVPDLTDEQIEAEISFIKQVHKSIVAISEIGLDYYWIKDEAKRKRTREVFRKMLDLAESLKMPIIVHSRGAAGDTLKEVSQFGGTVVLHSFPGSLEEVEVAISRGHYLSVAPSIYRSRQKQDLVKITPLERLLTESDAPVLGIKKEERNEPSSVVKVIAKIAELKGKEECYVREVLMDNFNRVFQKSLNQKKNFII
ncbi:MAG: TatD family hydrolase [Thermoproteota archaeon]